MKGKEQSITENKWHKDTVQSEGLQQEYLHKKHEGWTVTKHGSRHDHQQESLEQKRLSPVTTKSRDCNSICCCNKKQASEQTHSVPCSDVSRGRLFLE